MNKALTAVCLLIPVFVFSQVPAIKKMKKQRPAPQWDTLYFKNELSLDISPAVAFVTGAINSRESFGLTYRHFFDKNDAIRIGTRHGVDAYIGSDDRLYGKRFIPDSVQTNEIKVGDTLFVSSFFRSNTYSPDIRIGYEHRFGKRRFKCMLGMDAVLGIEHIRDYSSKSYYSLQAYTDSAGTAYYLAQVPPSVFPPYQENVYTLLRVGFSPFVGVQVHLSRRFSLNAGFLMDVAWNISLTGDDSYEGLNLYAYAPAADIGLTVHF